MPEIHSPYNCNDFIYIQDVVNAFEIAIKASFESGIYNLANGYSTSVYEICKIIENSLKGSINISEKLKENNQTEKKDFWGNISKLEKELNWSPKFSIENGVLDTIKFLNNNS
jgi:UDP-glucose 4-epimerase